MNVYLRLPDGSFECRYASHYTVDSQQRVYSVRGGRILKKDAKGRVWLSLGGKRTRVPVSRIYEDSLAYVQHNDAAVKVFTSGYTAQVSMGGYNWRVAAEAHFTFDIEREQESYICEQEYDWTLLLNFDRKLHRDKVERKPAFVPTFNQLEQWSLKYADELLSLPCEYGLYRNLSLLRIEADLQQVLHNSGYADDTKWLILYACGDVSTLENSMLKRRSPKLDKLRAYDSTLLYSNRLVFDETAGLISGPFTPLLTWAYRGRAPKDWVLFNVTGNRHDFNASNYVWVPPYMYEDFNDMRRWLTRLWYYEVM